MKMSQAEVEKALAEYPPMKRRFSRWRVKPTPTKPVENWYYLDEALTLHQLGKWQGFDAAYAEMDRAATKRGVHFVFLVCEDQVKDWRAQLDRWLGDDNYPNKYKKRKGDL